MIKPLQTLKHLLLRLTPVGWIRQIIWAILLVACHSDRVADGGAIESQILLDNNLRRDFDNLSLLGEIAADINCADSAVLGKRLVLAEDYHSSDTSEILLIPYIANGKTFKSSAYSDIKNCFVLVNPTYIHEFTLKNTLNDTTSYRPVLEVMLLHEIGHFILKKPGAFDELNSEPNGSTGERRDNTQPEFLTSIKQVELSADSLAIDLVKRQLKPNNHNCLNVAFDVERVIPGMQFQLSGTRMIENFGSSDIGFLHDPSNEHPNLELRVTFMNYFLFPSDTLRQMIDNYLYDRIVAPVHRQEFDPRIFQGLEKKLPGQ